MKLFFAAFLLGLCVFCSCRKDSFISTPDALLQTSVDSLHFDTVFTTTGSITKQIKIINVNDQKLRLSGIRLYGGSNSFFKMNVDGIPGSEFTDIELAANDSLYVFVTVTVNPTAANLPFLIQDSIGITYNGNNRFIQLDAYGQNARFLRNRSIRLTETFTNDLPYVILGGLTVENGGVLTIDKGAKLFCHADAAILINGTLQVNGTSNEPVTFSGDRLDTDYRDLPGSWPGIYFSSSSNSNVLTYAIIKNGYQGVVSQQPSRNGQTKIVLNECTIDNIYDAGLLLLNTSLNARNCLITNCGNNIAIGSGGNYNFTHCTVASFGNYFIAHRRPVLFVSNSNTLSQVNALTADFTNCVLFGDGGTVDDEIEIVKAQTTLPFALTFRNVLYKALKSDPATMGSGVVFTNSILNEPPLFDSIDINKRIYNFRPGLTSPLVNAGITTTGTLFDLDGKTRATVPDIGCYEQ